MCINALTFKVNLGIFSLNSFVRLSSLHGQVKKYLLSFFYWVRKDWWQVFAFVSLHKKTVKRSKYLFDVHRYLRNTDIYIYIYVWMMNNEINRTFYSSSAEVNRSHNIIYLKRILSKLFIFLFLLTLIEKFH